MAAMRAIRLCAALIVVALSGSKDVRAQTSPPKLLAPVTTMGEVPPAVLRAPVANTPDTPVISGDPPAITFGTPTLVAPAPKETAPEPPPPLPPPQGKGPPSFTPDVTEDQTILVTIKTNPPGPSELFRLETEMDWRERMRRDARQRSAFVRLEFPETRQPPALQKGIIRSWPVQTEFVEPNYVCYRRLFFEEINTERYGWSLGVLQPYASVGTYFWNLGLLPFRLLAAPYPSYECNAGYCLPGDPVPYLLYPPGGR